MKNIFFVPLIFLMSIAISQDSLSLHYDFLYKQFQDNPTELEYLNQSISKIDSSNYLVFALNDWRNNDELWGIPLFHIKNDTLRRPYSSHIKKYFEDHNRFFSIDFGGKTSGVMKYVRGFGTIGQNFRICYFDTTLITNARNTHQNYLTIASTLFPISDKFSGRRFGTKKEKEEAKKYAVIEFRSLGVKIINKNDIEVIDVQFISPEGYDEIFSFNIFRYHEQKKNNIEMHYLSLFYSVNQEKFNPIFTNHTHCDENSYKGTSSYFFIDIIDYDFDGRDEFIFLKTAYESEVFTLYKLENSKFIEIYSADESRS